MRNTADMIDKPITVWSQSTSGMSAVGPQVAFYDIPGKKGNVLVKCGRLGEVSEMLLLSSYGEIVSGMYVFIIRVKFIYRQTSFISSYNEIHYLLSSWYFKNMLYPIYLCKKRLSSMST
jgi:hypothetical protein